ncbi:MAG: hypothetical protein F4W90_00005 [Gammaproteobacteria bacterium]|nr:hypothetical protein [Gammaproteobacteria bacterium]
MVTTNQNMRYQQNFTAIGLAIVMPMVTVWPKAQHRTNEICAVIQEVMPSSGSPDLNTGSKG